MAPLLSDLTVFQNLAKDRGAGYGSFLGLYARQQKQREQDEKRREEERREEERILEKIFSEEEIASRRLNEELAVRRFSTLLRGDTIEVTTDPSV